MRRTQALAAALDLAARGFRIAPGWPVIRGLDGALRCGCNRDCKRPGKHTWLACSWYLAASSDPARITPWFTHRLSSILCLMGGSLAVITLDIDGPDGELSLAQLVTELGELPPTLTQITGRGRHLLFVVPHLYVDLIKNRVAIAPGIDVRSERGYIRVGGLHVTGTEYRWVDPAAPIATLPERWYQFLIERSIKARASRTAPADRPADDRLPSVEECEDRALAYIDHRPPAISGERGHDALYDVALDLVRGFVIEPDRAEQLIGEHYDPRCVPGWSDDEIAHKVDSAYATDQVGWAYHCGLVEPESAAPRCDRPRREQGDANAHTWHASSALERGPEQSAAPPENRISIGLPQSHPNGVAYCTARIANVEPGAVLKLLVTDGEHRGTSLKLPVDWPETPRSQERWSRLAHALGRERIGQPKTLKDERLRIEIIRRDGRLRVGRIYPLRRACPPEGTTS